MRKYLSIAAASLAIFAAGYGYGRWFRKDPLPVVAAAGSNRAILYYRCPMHPGIKSDRPGTAPCCNMALAPVYAEAQPAPHTPPPGAVLVSPEQRETIGVKFGAAEYAPVSESIRALARVALDETRVAYVQTKLEGWVDQILVNSVGTEVRKGQALLTVYHPKSMAAQQELLEAMKAAGPESPQRPPNADGLVAAARLRLELMGFMEPQIETIMKTHQAMWKLPVFAPISGVVIERNVLARQKLTPETLFTIADLSRVWVTADVFAPDAGRIETGQEVALTVPAAPGKIFRGTVDSILPRLDPASHTLKIRAQVDNPERLLRPEMYGDLEISRGVRHRALTVPRDAVLDRGLRQIVFIESAAGYLEPREVQTGRRFGGRVEIVRGLKAGQRIVVSGHFLIDSESRLNASVKGSDDRAGH